MTAPGSDAEGQCAAVVREWRDEEGWGVLDSPETPGGCWAHFSAIEMAGFHRLSVGQRVMMHWRSPGQDGYSYLAETVIP